MANLAVIFIFEHNTKFLVELETMPKKCGRLAYNITFVVQIARLTLCVRDDLQKFLKILLEEIEDRFLNDFTENKAFFDELTLLCPENVVKTNDISTINLAFLCEYNNLNEAETKSEFLLFASKIRGEMAANEVPTETNYDIGIHEETVEASNLKEMRNNWAILKSFFANPQNQARFKNVHILYKYVFSLPSTQVSCERSFSIMSNVKSSKRTMMIDETLESYMIISSGADLLSTNTLPDIIDQLGHNTKELRKKLIC